jgi:hypothetical protein
LWRLYNPNLSAIRIIWLGRSCFSRNIRARHSAESLEFHRYFRRHLLLFCDKGMIVVCR